MRSQVIVAALVGLALSGCVEPFEGSHMQFSLDKFQTPCLMLLANHDAKDNPIAEAAACSGLPELGLGVPDQRFNYHYEMWATVNKSSAVHLFSFTVQRHIFPDEQKAQEAAGVLRSNGKPLIMGGRHGYYTTTKSPSMSATDRATADKQMAKSKGKFVITSYSEARYEDDKAKQKVFHKDFYVGNYGQLTLPHNGTYYGQVKASHPYGAVTLNGASVRVAPNLEQLDSIWITIDKARYDRADPKPNRGLVVMRGVATRAVRGVINVEAFPTQKFQSGSGDARALFGIIPAMGEEEYF